jgi:hypothetical protein
MKKLLFLYLLFLIACTKVNKEEAVVDETKMSACIAAKVEKFKTEPRLQDYSFVSEYTLNQKLYYHFDYGSAADWQSYVLDNQCDTICTLGHFVPKCKIDDFFGKATKVKTVFE